MAAEAAQRHAAIAQRRRRSRRYRQRRIISRDCLAQPTKMLRGDAGIDQCIDMPRVDRDRGLRRLECLVIAMQFGEDRALVGERSAVVRLEAEGIVVARQCPLVAAERSENIAAIEIGFGKVRLDCDRLLATRQSLLGATEVEQHGAAIAQGLVIIAPHCERRFIGHKRLLELAESAQSIAAVVHRRGKHRVQHQGTIILGERTRMVPGNLQCEREIECRLIRSWAQLDRSIEQPDGLSRIATVELDQSQQMEGVEIAGIGAQQRGADAPRIVQTAGFVICECIHDGRCRKGSIVIGQIRHSLCLQHWCSCVHRTRGATGSLRPRGRTGPNVSGGFAAETWRRRPHLERDAFSLKSLPARFVFDFAHDPVRKVCNFSGSCAKFPVLREAANGAIGSIARRMGQEETAFVLNAARSLRHPCGKRAVPLAHLEHFLIQTGHLEKTRDRYADMREPRRSG